MKSRFWDWIGWVLAFTGAVTLALRWESLVQGSGTEDALWIQIVITTLLITAPLLIPALRFQHGALRNRKLAAKRRYNFSQSGLAKGSNRLFDASAAQSSFDASLFSQLKAVTDLHELKFELEIIDSAHRYIDACQLNGSTVRLSVTRGSLKRYTQRELQKLFSELIIFHELNSGNLFNKPEDPFPTNNYVPMDVDTTYMLALWLFIDAIRKLRKADHEFAFSDRNSFLKRRDALAARLAQENEQWSAQATPQTVS